MTARRQRARESGLTLLEILIAIAIMAVMMALAWRTLSSTATTRQTFEAFEQRNHELRMALGRVAADFEAAYLSKHEDANATYPRTMFIAKANSKLPEIRFSTMGHRVLWADANESEQTVIWYLSRQDPERPGKIDWVRREQRRQSNDPPEELASEFDVLLRDVTKVELTYWNWKTLEWVDTWDTTQSDGQRGWLPSRVKIAITVKDATDKDYTLTTQARILMQEPLLFSP